MFSTLFTIVGLFLVCTQMYDYFLMRMLDEKTPKEADPSK
jgi:hypothetical protein